jgi:hypothetical protein
VKSIGQLLANDYDMAAQRARAQRAFAHVAGLAAIESDPQLPPEPRRYRVRLAMQAFRECSVTASTSADAIALAVAECNEGRVKPPLLFHTTYVPYAVRLHRWGKWHDLPCHDVAPPSVIRDIQARTIAPASPPIPDTTP